MESFYPHRSLRLSASRSSGRVECEEKTGIRQRKTKSHTHWVAETSMQGARIFFSRRYRFIFFFIARPSRALLHLNTLLQGFAFFRRILWQSDRSTSNHVPIFTFIPTIFLFFIADIAKLLRILWTFLHRNLCKDCKRRSFMGRYSF